MVQKNCHLQTLPESQREEAVSLGVVCNKEHKQYPGGCFACLYEERDTLLQTLATERDAFGKKETELIKQRDELNVENQRLLTNFLKEKFVTQLQIMEEDRDHWQALAEKMMLMLSSPSSGCSDDSGGGEDALWSELARLKGTMIKTSDEGTSHEE